MKRVVFLFSLIAIFCSCNNSKTKSMSANKETTSESDSANGYAPVNGINMYYEIHGKGSPVVLIHGGGSTIQSTFGEILPLLAMHHQVIAMELQAHGRTSDRNSPESFAQDAKDVVALLQYLEIPKADIIGFSNGGQTAMQIGISYPAFVNKLVLISCFYKRDGALPGMFDNLRLATIDNMPSLLKSSYLQVHNDTNGLQTMFEKDRQRMIDFKDWSDEDLQSIKANSFIICGDHDIVTTAHAVKMSQLIPDARLMILPGTHGSFIGEICSKEKGSKLPQLTVEAIEEFFSKPN
jgi:pimeloyl-ACP methyl ester carboxylesterase